MAVRVRLRVKCAVTGKEVDVIALVNSGFEALTPKLLIPIKVAEILGLWPSLPKEAFSKSVETAGGPASKYVVPKSLSVKVALEDRDTEEVPCDAMISSIEREVLISDKLAGELGIILEDIGEGVWRLKDDNPGVKRRSENRQLW